MGALSKHHIATGQRDKLRDAQPGICRSQQQRAIPAPEPSRRIRCGHQHLDLLMVQKIDVLLLETLSRGRQHALDEGTDDRFIERGITQEGVYRRQAGVAGAGTIAASLFRWSKKAASRGASRSRNAKLEGALLVRAWTKRSNSQTASRSLATVRALA